MISVERRMADTGGRPAGFDYMRIVLSLAVITFHSMNLVYGDAWAAAAYRLPVIRPVHLLILPMFFSLSGFLIAGSIARSRTIFMFLGLRVIRIYPALIMEVLLSALILGPVFTRVALSTYFSDHQFWRYMVNVTGHVSYHLPGVFLDNPVPRTVNAQLWTVPYELICYVTITAAMLFGLVHRRGRMAAVVGLFVVVQTLAYLRAGDVLVFPRSFWHMPGYMLVMSFLSGILIFLYQDVVAWDWRWGVGSAVATALLFSFPVGMPVGILCAAYLTVYLGLTNPVRIRLIRGADYSYGLFLYGYPIQQALVATGSWARSGTINLIATVVVASCFATFSWHFVEKPALRLRTKLKEWEPAWENAVSRARRRSPIGSTPLDAGRPRA